MNKGKGKKPVVSLDLGGTKIMAAVVSRDGELLARERVPTLAEEGPEPVIGRILMAIRGALNKTALSVSDIDSISLAVAGPIDMEKGIVTQSPNLPGWRGIPLRDIIQEEFQLRTFLINDAKAAALGEYHLGAGRGVRHLIYLTVSTGIGGGIIIDGKLYFGASGAAGEVGHMTIDTNGPRCSCGNIGCLEVLASGKAVAGDARKRIESGEKSLITEIAEDGLITAETVGMAAERGDPLALRVILRAAEYLGVGLVNIVNIFNPEMIVIGGGLSRMGDLLLDPARKVVSERAFRISAGAVKITEAELKDDAGVFGAAVFAFNEDGD